MPKTSSISIDATDTPGKHLLFGVDAEPPNAEFPDAELPQILPDTSALNSHDRWALNPATLNSHKRGVGVGGASSVWELVLGALVWELGVGVVCWGWVLELSVGVGSGRWVCGVGCGSRVWERAR